MPKAVWMLSAVFIINTLLITYKYQQIKISTFDPQLAKSLGINITYIHYLLMGMLSLSIVASFESVGSIPRCHDVNCSRGNRLFNYKKIKYNDYRKWDYWCHFIISWIWHCLYVRCFSSWIDVSCIRYYFYLFFCTAYFS